MSHLEIVRVEKEKIKIKNEYAKNNVTQHLIIYRPFKNYVACSL
jgi:hypothetical protein